MEYVIRKATEEDAYGIAYVSAYSWKETYTGFMPDEYLEERIKNIDSRVDSTKMFLKDNKDTYYVAVLDNKVVGICYYSNSQNEKYNDYGLLGALYVLKDYQKLGIGKKLFETAIIGLINMGYNNMYLECLKGNKTIDFYKHFCGEYKETIQYPISNFKVEADVLVFKNLKQIQSLFSNNHKI